MLQERIIPTSSFRQVGLVNSALTTCCRPTFHWFWFLILYLSPIYHSHFHDRPNVLLIDMRPVGFEPLLVEGFYSILVICMVNYSKFSYDTPRFFIWVFFRRFYFCVQERSNLVFSSYFLQEMFWISRNFENAVLVFKVLFIWLSDSPFSFVNW
jgi:hypothetical protein